MLNRSPAAVVVDVERSRDKLLFRSLYGAALALYIFPMADLLYTLVPLDVGSVQWRFGAVGFGAQMLWSHVLALSIVVVSAWLTGHRWVLRLVSLYCLLLVLVIVMIGGVSVLDYLQLRRAVVQPMKPKLDAAAMRLFVQLGLAALVAIPLALAAWRSAKTPSAAAGSSGDELGLLYGVRAKQSSRGAS